MSVPAPFDYHPAQTVDEAIALLQQYGDEAKVLAGGHSLIPAMKLRLSQPGHLVDIGRISGLSYIREEQGVVAIGSLTTYTQIESSDVLKRDFPIIPECASVIADQQVRNRGTIGGSIAHSDPASDMPGVVLALRGEIVAQGPNGKRTIKADDFFVGMFTTALEPDEILLEIRFTVPPARTGSAYEKLANKASHYAVAGAAAVVTLDSDGTCTSAGVAITGAAIQTTRASAVEAALVGKKLDEATVAEAASHATDGLELVADIHGSQEYRRQMTAVITRRAILRALERA
ncbi:carbon monoxide dehydrogenase [Reticulibacter mediterranei]|uniref:Carbon monoxide dehydrogenase n=1 Tax=Reticulibacter mediterranei TaxID=2778369 RepID=A0A8J3IQV2_9CHLR|nr:xanthine dehydrogenase family protein subunit M [Reticulibacter mediterranei]GHO96830.1 carbon monoxide dehydrogenase [Reticulibacter mediterranei]